jgi:hypothetical protein
LMRARSYLLFSVCPSVRVCFCFLWGREEVKKQDERERKRKNRAKENANEGVVLGAFREAHRATFIVNSSINCFHRACKI